MNKGQTVRKRVSKHTPILDRFKNRFQITDGCWNWTKELNKWGYGIFYFNRRTIFAHRVSYEYFIGEIPSGMKVCHTCDNPKCCSPFHLFLGSHADNMHDMALKGRSPKRKGSLAPTSKLTEQEAMFILKSNIKPKLLSEKYNISQSVVYNIRNRKSWTHLTT